MQYYMPLASAVKPLASKPRCYPLQLESLETRLSLGDALVAGVLGTSWLMTSFGPAEAATELTANDDALAAQKTSTAEISPAEHDAILAAGRSVEPSEPWSENPPMTASEVATPNPAFPASQRLGNDPGGGDVGGQGSQAAILPGRLARIVQQGSAPGRHSSDAGVPERAPDRRPGFAPPVPPATGVPQAGDLHLIEAALSGSQPGRGRSGRDDPYWAEPMQEVHQNYNNTYGDAVAISRFGDSITVSQAFFQPLAPLESGGRNYVNIDADAAAALAWIRSAVPTVCWTWQVSGVDQHGAQGGVTSDWPLGPVPDTWPDYMSGERKIDYWLRRDNPAIAVIMLGTNDLPSSVTPDVYEDNLQQIVSACEANGTVPVLTAPPPRHGFEDGPPELQDRADAFQQAVWDLAFGASVPLIDYHGEILARNPHNPPLGTWDGADPTWDGYSGYEVPTSISRDGIHPSNWSAGLGDFMDGLNTNGYELRNYLTLQMAYQVDQYVIAPA
jgi:hypothetical protein